MVIRNKYEPEFSKNPYLIAIDETEAIMSSVGQITVSDMDANVSFIVFDYIYFPFLFSLAQFSLFKYIFYLLTEIFYLF